MINCKKSGKDILIEVEFPGHKVLETFQFNINEFTKEKLTYATTCWENNMQKHNALQDKFDKIKAELNKN